MATLFVVPTPIGNLEDITLRAIRILKEAPFVLAEDTRTSGNLLKHLGIRKPMMAYHLHNEHVATPRIVERILLEGSAALVTDAGTPGISDPGFLIIRACLEAEIRVECLPGPTSIIPAIVSSGIPCDRFCFEGFLPHKKGRQTRLKLLTEETRTMVFFESPHRLVKALDEFSQHFGPERVACVCRELSKMFEEVRKGSVAELAQYFGSKPVKGEIVIVVSGKA
ncbi:MAG: 16S rRNA (cytidine(1402)-2'-O)-methyltransferase [Bacteroidetes bacterium]|nr:16S rRNA (cytidine(1402)-2'-O)-methyltransferase [Bacteroidota bacterium]MBU1717812.1 16S rRNA (cytidine(1402)-2'-O)-methyltransferase [Bacteroidota bacterium]